jgi:hypothetical protein
VLPPISSSLAPFGPFPWSPRAISASGLFKLTGRGRALRTLLLEGNWSRCLVRSHPNFT